MDRKTILFLPEASRAESESHTMNKSPWAVWAAALTVAAAGAAAQEPGGPATAPATHPAAEQEELYRRHVETLRATAPAGFTVVAARPFVVIGDGPAEAVATQARGTVAWAVRLLKQDYFTADPEHIIDIWLFQDADSYTRHTLSLFHERPISPYGYFSPAHAALIMNIATGGGTLVHEIVHPFMRANFPACPPWLNEGLASLYEQCVERDGHIHGLTNWRLAGLQEAIRGGKCLSLEKLCALDGAGFYGEGSGLHYAMARYLCYYLQEQGLLVQFYRAAADHAGADPTGYHSLQKVSGAADMVQFQQRWEAWVLTLKFGG